MTSGLRERKKQRTREQIAETARELFTEHGFDRVTVAEVARAAEVSEQTVFNYFADARRTSSTGGSGRSRRSCSRRSATAAPGESVLAAFRRFVLAQGGLLGRHDPEAREQLTAFTRMIVGEPGAAGARGADPRGLHRVAGRAARRGDRRAARRHPARGGRERADGRPPGADRAHPRRGSSPAASSPRSRAASAPRPSTRSTCSRAASATTGAAGRGAASVRGGAARGAPRGAAASSSGRA